MVLAVYAGCGIVATLGAIAPRLFYGPGAVEAGPLFWPLAGICALATTSILAGLTRAALASQGKSRRRRGALAVGCLLGALGGGAAISVHVLGIANVQLAAPVLFPAVGLAAYAVLTVESGRGRELVVQGLAYAAITAALSAVGLTVYYTVLPGLTPDGGRSAGWLMLVTFFAALPLDPLRMLMVERAGRALFANPIGVRDLADQVDRTEARADHAERLAEIGRLASAVAHEIRNPLGVIAAQAKLLERAGASPASVAALRAQVDRARRFLDDLLRYSRPRPLERSEIEVLPVVELAVSGVRAGMGEQPPPIELALDIDRHATLDVDRSAFQDVVATLVHNAAIAIDGSETGRVRVGARATEGGLELTVEDDGPGVPPEIEATLFDPFVTGRGRDARHPGTGLGLAIASRWVARHGGTLRHERPSSGGARFVAFWPGRVR